MRTFRWIVGGAGLAFSAYLLYMAYYFHVILDAIIRIPFVIGCLMGGGLIGIYSIRVLFVRPRPSAERQAAWDRLTRFDR